MRVGIIGLGSMGTRHVEAARQAGLQVTSVCDVNRTRAREAKSLCGDGSCRTFHDTQLMLSESSLDAVVVATPSSVRVEIVEQAARSGIPIILAEKPFARSVSAAVRCVAACEANGTQLFINHQVSVTPKMEFLKNTIYSDKFGGLCSWVVAAGDIGLAMGASHLIRQFMVLVPNQSYEVSFEASGYLNPNPRGEQFVDPAGQLRIRAEDGTRFYLDFDSRQGHGMRSLYSGPTAQLVLDELSGEGLVSYRTIDNRELPPTRYGSAAIERQVKIDIPDPVRSTVLVWKSIMGGDGRATSGNDGILITRVLVAAIQSAQLGGTWKSVTLVADGQSEPQWP